MQLVIRFLVGGLIVSLFALLADVLKPKSFAGLFGAAPSVAVATLGLTVMSEGTAYATLEARSMVLGAVALMLYAAGCTYLIGTRGVRAAPASIGMLAGWLLIALALKWALLQ